MKAIPLLLKSLAAGMICCALNAQAQNLVQDPGFELSPGSTGAPGGFSSSWTLSPPTGTSGGQQLSNVGTNPSFAHSGNNHANLEYSSTAAFGSLSQTLMTVAGQTYNLSFWLANFVALPTNFFQVYWNGALVFSTMSPPFSNSGAYQLITASNLLATGGSTALEFRYRHDQDYWYLDDVSVTRAPEGSATMWVMLPVFFGLCLLHFRLRRGGVSA